MRSDSSVPGSPGRLVGRRVVEHARPQTVADDDVHEGTLEVVLGAPDQSGRQPWIAEGRRLDVSGKVDVEEPCIAAHKSQAPQQGNDGKNGARAQSPSSPPLSIDVRIHLRVRVSGHFSQLRLSDDRFADQPRGRRELQRKPKLALALVSERDP